MLLFRNSVVYDGKIIILIEGLDKFVDHDSDVESNIKFWLPKYFPKRFRVIVTTDRDTKSYEYLKKLGCRILSIEMSEQTISSIMESFFDKKFIMPKSYVDSLAEVLNEKISSGKLTGTLLFKTAVACLCPYDVPGHSPDRLVQIDKIREILLDFDPKK